MNGAFNIARTKNCTTRKVRLQLYNSFVRSHLEYCLPIWSNGKNFKKLISIQKRTVHQVLNIRNRYHTNSIFKELEILKLNDLVELNCKKTAMKIFNNLAPDGVSGLLVKCNARRNHTLNNVQVPQNYSRYKQICSKLAISWNSVHTETKAILDPKALKQIIEQAYIVNYPNTVRCANIQCRECM